VQVPRTLPVVLSGDKAPRSGSLINNAAESAVATRSAPTFVVFAISNRETKNTACSG